MASLFSCNFQLAKNRLDEVTEKGELDFQQFKEVLASIDWEFESDRLQFLNKTWPSIAVTNCASEARLWMTAYRPLPPDFLDTDEFRSNMAVWFIVRLDNPPDQPNIVDLSSRKALSECYFETWNLGEIEELFRDFFRNDYDSLYESLYSMKVAEVDDP